MKRHLVFVSAWFTLASGFALAAPARPLHEPAERAKAVSVDLNGTVWLGKYLTVNRTFVFEADGTLSYKSTAKTAKVFKNRGSWRVEGNKISFEHFIQPNLKLMQFQGILIDANTIAGEATFANGTKAQQTMQRTTLTIK